MARGVSRKTGALAAQSVPELIELVRSKPGELNYPWAYATTSHIAGELFKSMTGTDILNINARTLTLP